LAILAFVFIYGEGMQGYQDRWYLQHYTSITNMIDDIVSPDQSYKVAFSCYEVRMSHWIEQPNLIRVSDNQVLFTLNGDSWSAFNVQWLDDATVQMIVAKYPGRISCQLQLNASTNQGTVTNAFNSFTGTLREVSNWVLSL
jgi:hypothetical protein